MLKIEMNKTYRTRDGKPVRILCVDRLGGGWPVVALVTEGASEFTVFYTSAGSLSNEVCEADLIEVSPYEDYKIDDPVMVRDFASEPWKRRHFAGLNQDGKPTAFLEGRTSFSARNGDSIAWAEMRRPTEEELKGAA